MRLRLCTTNRIPGFYCADSSGVAAFSHPRSYIAACSYIALKRSHSHRPPSSAKTAASDHSHIAPACRTYRGERHRERRGPKLGRSATSGESGLYASSHLRANLAVPLAAGVACVILAALFLRQRQPDIPSVGQEAVRVSADMPATQALPGRPGNLTSEQEEKLRQLWQMIFQVCGVWPTENGSSSTTAAEPVADKAEKTKKKRSIFSRKGKKDGESEPATPPSAVGSALLVKEGDDDKYGQTKHFYETLASQAPDSIRDTIWSMLKHDHPDALVLRFLRARKWDVEKALVMLVSTMNWRAQDMHVDDDIMKNGEGAAAELEKGTDAAARVSHDFLDQMRMGKSFIHGVDKAGRPICVVRVRLHRQGEQVEESLERYTVYIIETARMLLRPPVDTAVSAGNPGAPSVTVC